MRGQDRFHPQEVEKPGPIVCRDSVLLRDFGAAQHFAHFFDLARSHEEHEGAAAPCIDELPLEPVPVQEAADELVRVE
jgi:hypothetical protein